MTYNAGYGGGQPPKKKQNSGFIVPNDRKRTANDPDMRGSFTLGEDVAQFIIQGGRELWMSAWHKQARNPKTGVTGPLTSISMQPKVPRVQGQQYGVAPPQPTGWGMPPPVQPQAPQGYGHHPVSTPAMYPLGGAPTPQGWGQQQVQQQGPQNPYQGPQNPMDQDIPF